MGAPQQPQQPDQPGHGSRGPAGDAAWQVRVQQAGFDVSAELAQMQGGDLDIGGIGLFVGTVRDLHPAADGTPAPALAALQALELEHYPGMTERQLAGMLDEARQRFGLRAGRIVHRVGRLAPGEPIVLVMAAAAHRHAALDGCAFLMDWLKTDAPFWKKEHTGAGSRWVPARESDDRALARWGRRSGNTGAVQGQGGAGETRGEARGETRGDTRGPQAPAAAQPQPAMRGRDSGNAGRPNAGRANAGLGDEGPSA